ncbi:MAG: class I SAM-dependent methyltransferase [Flavobacteriales bacterium]|nr:class I SAM-dependent methyltransferase [Flavobacteriales bacterium]
MEKLEGCPICNHTQSTLFLECRDYTVSQEMFSIEECSNCGFRYTNPRPSESEIGPYYKSEAYISHTNSGKGVVNAIYKQVRKYTLSQKFKLIEGFASGKSILDYGSGAGVFLEYCRKNKWDTKGVEADRETRERVISDLDLDIIASGQISTLGNEEYDVITLWHVLEHVHQLKETMQVLVGSLKEDGVLIIAVPNCASFDAEYYEKYWAAYDVPRHLYHFRPNDISKLFSELGMKVMRVLPMFFDSYYVSMLSEKHKTGATGLLGGTWNGLRSNLKGKTSESYSSQIYVLRKNKTI